MKGSAEKLIYGTDFTVQTLNEKMKYPNWDITMNNGSHGSIKTENGTKLVYVPHGKGKDKAEFWQKTKKSPEK